MSDIGSNEFEGESVTPEDTETAKEFEEGTVLQPDPSPEVDEVIVEPEGTDIPDPDADDLIPINETEQDAEPEKDV